MVRPVALALLGSLASAGATIAYAQPAASPVAPCRAACAERRLPAAERGPGSARRRARHRRDRHRRKTPAVGVFAHAEVRLHRRIRRPISSHRNIAGRHAHCLSLPFFMCAARWQCRLLLGRLCGCHTCFTPRQDRRGPRIVGSGNDLCRCVPRSIRALCGRHRLRRPPSRSDWHGEANCAVDAGHWWRQLRRRSRGTALLGGRYSYTAGIFSLISPEIRSLSRLPGARQLRHHQAACRCSPSVLTTFCLRPRTT
jgi:hypothetical protein